MREVEAEIARLNAEMEEKAQKANGEWRRSPEWKALLEKEIEAARIQHAAEKRGGPKKKIEQSWRGKKFRVEKLKQGEYTRGVDAWRYVKHVAAPLMWPECLWRLQHNLDFVLMEDSAPCHSAHYTS